jgi:hypothetical protein
VQFIRDLPYSQEFHSVCDLPLHLCSSSSSFPYSDFFYYNIHYLTCISFHTYPYLIICVYLYFVFFWPGDGTQGLAHSRQLLYFHPTPHSMCLPLILKFSWLFTSSIIFSSMYVISIHGASCIYPFSSISYYLFKSYL